MYIRICGVPRRRDENADAETGIGTPSVPDLGLAVENGPRGRHVQPNVETALIVTYTDRMFEFFIS